MVVLGVDPGLRHTGWCVLRGNRAVARGTIVPPGRGKMSLEEILSYVLPRLKAVADEWEPDIAVVEQVTWYGRPKRITLPLSHVAGAIIGVLLLRCPVYVFIASMKKGKPPRGKTWDEHQKDAYVLATVAKKAENAWVADASSIPRDLSAAVRRRITTLRNARGSP